LLAEITQRRREAIVDAVEGSEMESPIEMSVLYDDKKGQRTGFVTKYTENTLYATKYIGTTVMLRPELRFDHSWDLEAYNDGKARNQLFFGMDLIYKF
jgi:hypothetical protein